MHRCTLAVPTVLALTLAFTSCGSPGVSGPTDSLLTDKLLFLALAQEPTAHMDALFQGTVVVDDAGCIRLGSDGGSTVVWPHGSRLQSNGAVVRVIAADGREIGRLGGEFRFGGGHVPDLHEGIAVADADRQHAQASCPGDFWITGDID